MQKVWRVWSHMRGGVLGVFDSKKIAERVQEQNPGSFVEFGLSNGGDDPKPLSCGQWLEGLLSLTTDEAIDVMTNHVEEIESAITHESVALSKFADLVNACSDVLAGDPALIAARVALGYDEPEEEDSETIAANNVCKLDVRQMFESLPPNVLIDGTLECVDQSIARNFEQKIRDAEADPLRSAFFNE